MPRYNLGSPPGLLWSTYFLFWGFGIVPRDPLGAVGVAWGSSALRASVLPDLPSLCRGKTGDSTQLPSLQLFPILEFGAGAGRSFYRPHRVGEGPLCPATFLTRKPIPGVSGSALSLGSALKLFTRGAQLWARGTSRAVITIRQAGTQAACPAPASPQGSICLCPRAGKASIVPLQRALVWHLRSLWGGMRPQFLPAQPSTLAAIAGTLEKESALAWEHWEKAAG